MTGRPRSTRAPKIHINGLQILPSPGTAGLGPGLIGVCHSVSAIDGAYTHYFFILSEDLPHRILKVSARIPLFRVELNPWYWGVPDQFEAFASGFDANATHFFLSYGAGDVESRLSVFTAAHVAELFESPIYTLEE